MKMLEFVNEFTYLGSLTDKIGGCRKKAEKFVTQGRKVAGVMEVIVKNWNLSMKQLGNYMTK